MAQARCRSSGTVAARTKIQALNRNCAKCSKARGHFPSDNPDQLVDGRMVLSRRDRVIVARHEYVFSGLAPCSIILVVLGIPITPYPTGRFFRGMLSLARSAWKTATQRAVP